MGTLAFLAVIGLVIWISTLQARIKDLEDRQHQPLTPPPVPSESKTTKSSTQKTQEKSTKETAFPWEENDSKPKTQTKIPEPHPPQPAFQWEDFFGLKFFAILGSVTLVFAIGFFAKWAFEHNIIGPQLRIAIGMLFSVGLLVLGEYLRKDYEKFFVYISSAGIAGLLITTFFARNYTFHNSKGEELAPLITGWQSIFAYVLEVSTGIVLSLRYNSRLLANISIIGGLIAPVFVGEEPAPLKLLSFMSLLTFAGFIISTQKRWPELIAVLFFGDLLYEIMIFNGELMENQPILFLTFIFLLHYLLGIGGIVRIVQQKIGNKCSPYEIFDILLFVVSVLAANGLAAAIFDQQADLLNATSGTKHIASVWDHLGFFVLAQGFGLYFLAEYLKRKEAHIFQKMVLGATMLSVIFATIWEIGTENEMVLTMMLALEGGLFCFASRQTQEIVFDIFGKIGLLLSLLFVFSIEPLIQNSVAVLTIIAIFLYSVGSPKSLYEKLWTGISIFFTTLILFVWNFDKLDNAPFILDSTEFLLFVLPSLWAVAITYSVLKTYHEFSRIAGLLIVGLVNFILWVYTTTEFSHEDQWLYVPIFAIFLVLAGNFVSLTAFFVTDKKIQASIAMQTLAANVILALCTVSIFFFGVEYLEEPVRTVFWVCWGALLLGFGVNKEWPHFRYFGMGTFLFLVGKIYLYDMWAWTTGIKVLAFLPLGIALIGISFYYHRKLNNQKKK